MVIATSALAMRGAEHLHDLAGRGSAHAQYHRLRKIPKSSRHEQARGQCRESQEGAVTPTPSSTVAVVPPTDVSSTFQPAATSTAKPSPAKATATAGSLGTAGNGAGSGQVNIANITHYVAGLGACGNNNTGDDLIAAVTAELYDSYSGHTDNPNKNPICGKKIAITYKGKSTTVTVADRCEGRGCADDYHLDLSHAAFKQLAPLDKGLLVGATWQYI
ncbi:hypothetical protein BDZ89DRAFT_1041179 [Hymenopellis radicata]|nr:hypothetical protein BDZ89DRAFT_1041179 [Hymenopellis radicata]